MPRYPFLIEVRPDQGVKNYLRGIINDVQSRFDVDAMASGHVVPHLSLYGPFYADGYGPVLSAVRQACQGHSIAPYRLDGFCHFRRDVIYVDIATSKELRELRRNIRDELLPESQPRHPRRESARHYQYHLTVAFKNIGGKFNEIWKYLNKQYDPDMKSYAQRVTFLNNRRMIKEWDLPTGRFLEPDEATSKQSWDRTIDALNRQQSAMDHQGLEKPHRGGVRELRRFGHRILARF